MSDLDLSQFDTKVSANEGAWLDLRNPTNVSEVLMRGGNPVRVKLLGKDSEVFRRITAKNINTRLKEASRGRNAAPATAEQLEADAIRTIAACTIAFENVVVDGREFKAPDDAEAFWKRFPAFREQADDFIGGRENFMKPA